MRNALLVVILAATVVGCAHPDQNPTVPSTGSDLGAHASRLHSELTGPSGLAESQGGPFRLLGEYTFFISAERDRVDVVPRRDMHFHLNALKFLEEYCTDCLQITGIKNNGDGTIDLTVRITHPFKGFPQYTGFDVKGIIMFQGSHELKSYKKYPPYPQNLRLSWRRMGDPELLNADGFSYRWSPWYDSGLPQPIFNYWEGRFAKGTPTANINGYLNFYSHEERHMFAHSASVSRTYHIWLPPGLIVAGYAVEACWEPPINTPVTNPIEDFPITANQPEAYRFKIVINDGNPVTDPKCCNTIPPSTVHEARAEIYTWYLPPEHIPGNYYIGTWADEEVQWCHQGCTTGDCEEPPEWRCFGNWKLSNYPNGVYQLIACEYHVNSTKVPWPIATTAMDVYEIVIDIPE